MSSMRRRPRKVVTPDAAPPSERDEDEEVTSPEEPESEMSTPRDKPVAKPLPAPSPKRDPGGGPPPTNVELLVDNKEKWKSWNRRFWATWAMLAFFVGIIALGHMPLMVLVFLCQTVMFKEIVALGHTLAHENELPGFRHLQWFWWVSAQYFTYSRLLISLSRDDEQGSLTFIFQHNTFVVFLMYVAGVVGFVFSLKKGHYKYQFGMFAWCHLAILMVVVQSSFIMHNMFNGGLIWFVLPSLLIINNDVWAYFFGFFWGRTPLIKISPKKTWEGFLGATMTTLVVGFYLARILAYFDMMICPKEDLSWAYPHCEREYPYIPQPYPLPQPVSAALNTIGLSNWTYVTISPIQFHGLFLAFFASVIAPFGGFFASGFKRAFKKKDFGDAIPGHGGVTDRMDCQIMMGTFVYVYFHTFVRPVTDVSTALLAFSRLPDSRQIEVFRKIFDELKRRGLITDAGIAAGRR